MALWTPANITTAVWYDASDSTTLFNATSGGSLPANTDAVLRWQDKSGNSRHVTETTNAPSRRVAEQNSLDVIRFDGTNDVLQSANFTLNQPYTIFVFLEFNGSPALEADVVGSTSPLISMRPNWALGGRLYFAGSNPKIEPALSSGQYIWGWTVNGASSKEHLNGDAEFTIAATCGTSALGNIRLGKQANGGACVAADYYEVIVCPSAIDTTTVQLIEGYGAHKWGLTSLLPSGHPYKSTAPSTASSLPIIGEGGLVGVNSNLIGRGGLVY
jgi:hypothetical protein